MEIRYAKKTEVRLGGNGRTLYGYAASFNRQSTDDQLGFREVIAPGAFRQSLDRDDDIVALVNHDPKQLLGRSSSGTLRLNEDKRGLRFEVDLPDTTVGNDLKNLIARRDLSECSFGFVCDADDWTNGIDEKSGARCAIRTLRAVTLTDVSVVTFPAYQGSTEANVRSLFIGAVPERLAVECRSRGIKVPMASTAEEDSRRIVRATLLSAECEKEVSEQRRRDAVKMQKEVLY